MHHFYYDESEHSRKINDKTIKSNNYYDNFVSVIVGWPKQKERTVFEKYQSFEAKYAERKDKNGELKSKTLKKNQFEFGFASMTKPNVQFVNDFLSLFDEDINFYFSIASKIEYLVLQLFSEYRSNFFFDADAMKYSITESTSSMYEKYIPEHYQRGQARGLLCATCIKWSSEKPLSEILSGPYFDGDNADTHIENTIKLLQDTVSFSVPLLIKPIIEICNEKSSMVACLQAGAYKRSTRKMIEIGVPRELAISLSNTVDFDAPDDMSSYDYDMFVRGRIKESLPTLRYWEQVQLDFLK